jgi:hypothetical protein
MQRRRLGFHNPCATTAKESAMASFGAALEALDDFRAELVDRQLNVDGAPMVAMAFRAGGQGDSPVHGVHATGVGIRAAAIGSAETADFVLKVFVYDEASREAASRDAFFRRQRQGVHVDVDVLPMQVAYATANPAQHRRRRRPVPGGVEIGPLGGSYVGTLGCFVRRGASDEGPIFALSNNHVLADVNRFAPGTRFTQPFSANSADVVAALSDFEPILFPAPGSQPRNVMDAAIAAVTDTGQIQLGRILNIARYTPTLRAPRPGMTVTKSGRTTGVTTGVITAIRIRGVTVNYGTQQNPLVATFDNAISIVGNGGVVFSSPGDSGSVILEKTSGRPVALLFAGLGNTTTACDINPVCARFGVRPV